MLYSFNVGELYNFTLFCMGVKLGVSQEVKNLDD
jgi:hypothetical protein